MEVISNSLCHWYFYTTKRSKIVLFECKKATQANFGGISNCRNFYVAFAGDFRKIRKEEK